MEMSPQDSYGPADESQASLGGEWDLVSTECISDDSREKAD